MLKMLLTIICYIVAGYSAVSQDTLQSFTNKRVVFKLLDTRKITGKVIHCQDSVVTILTCGNIFNTIGTQDIESCSEVRITCGPVIGLNSGSIGIDANLYNLNLYANASILLPVLFRGDFYTFSTGAGKLVKLGGRGWKLNLFTNVSAAAFDFLGWCTVVSAGTGIGFQYTGNNRFLCSFKIPVIGYTVYSAIDGKNVSKNPLKFRDNLTVFYLTDLLSLPLIAFGKSF